ncbi:STAS domain-containing protein [Thermodesulfobacteriota bacterium]
MEITLNQEGNNAKIVIVGDIDESGAEQLKSNFNKLNLSNTKEVVIDFARVNYVGSSGIGKLLLFYKNLAVNGGKIHIINVSNSLYDLFLELKLDSILSISKR